MPQRTTKTYTTEVFNSEGTLAIMRDGLDIAHVGFPPQDDPEDNPSAEEKQEIINVIVEALGGEGYYGPLAE